jgi:hypothetical protein
MYPGSHRLCGNNNRVAQVSELDSKQYDLLTKEELVCWRCGDPTKNIPTLNAHLLEEWKKEAKKSRARIPNKQHRIAKDDREAADTMQMDTD